MGSNGAISDRKRLADHLSKCADDGIDAHLTPELVTSALNVLRAFVAQTSYQLESVSAEGNVTVLSVVNDREILRAAFDKAVAQAQRYTVQIRQGTKIVSLEEALL
jgi:hypothetical protein